MHRRSRATVLCVSDFESYPLRGRQRQRAPSERLQPHLLHPLRVSVAGPRPACPKARSLSRRGASEEGVVADADGAAARTRRASRSPHGTAARASRCSENEEGVAESARGCPPNTRGILGKGQSIPPDRQGIPRSGYRSLTRAQGRAKCSEGCSRNFGGIPTRSHRNPRRSWSIRRHLQRRPSLFVGHPYEDVGMLPVERRKRSGLVGERETPEEMPWSFAGTLSVLVRLLSELAELRCVFVSMLAVFAERPSTWGRMLHPFRRTRYSFGRISLSAPTAAPRDRNGRHERSVGNSIEGRRRSTRTTGCSARTAGRSRDSWGRRAKARTGFAKSHAILTHFAAYPLRFGSGGADARSGPRHARRPFARTSGCRRWESRRQPRKGRCVRRAKRGGAAPTPHAPSTSASRAATS